MLRDPCLLSVTRRQRVTEVSATNALQPSLVTRPTDSSLRSGVSTANTLPSPGLPFQSEPSQTLHSTPSCLALSSSPDSTGCWKAAQKTALRLRVKCSGHPRPFPPLVSPSLASHTLPTDPVTQSSVFHFPCPPPLSLFPPQGSPHRSASGKLEASPPGCSGCTRPNRSHHGQGSARRWTCLQ